QAGIERFGDANLASADARVFMCLRDGLQALGIADPAATIGDLSIVLAVLDAIEMPSHRRMALKRHLWRPSRFQDLIRRACEQGESSAQRREALATTGSAREDLVLRAGEAVGVRTLADVSARLDDLAVRKAEPPMATRDAELLTDIFKVKGPAVSAVNRLRDLTERAAVDVGAALTQFEQRLSFLLEQGCPPESLHFDAGFGRNLEYYDGFVFEMRSAEDGVHPPLAGGGRYNAMTARMRAPSPIPAIGGIVRPEAVLEVMS
ncbi:MAG: ATP phosphoribosyltransferase regulatory subunit, partial [Pseudomonadota bacterium]